MLKKSLGLVSGAALIFVFAYGCSSSESNPTTPATDSGTGSETSKPKTDSGPDPVDDSGGGACAPGDVSTFEPTWKAPAGMAQAKCTETQVNALLDCQLDENADAAACKALAADKNNQTCGTCLLTNSSAAKYGPLISGEGVISINYAGCIALKDNNVTADGCGAKYQALGQCSTEACATNCPVSDDASFAAYQKCAQKAEEGAACSKFAGDAACVDDLVKAGGAAEDCDISGGDFISNAKKYGIMFCAGLTGDGGTDAATDAPADG